MRNGIDISSDEYSVELLHRAIVRGDLAYLLYHCGLKPEEIVQNCPQKWSDVQEVYRLRRSIIERMMRQPERLS